MQGEGGGKGLDKHNWISQFRDRRVGSDQLKHLLWRDGRVDLSNPRKVLCCYGVGVLIETD